MKNAPYALLFAGILVSGPVATAEVIQTGVKGIVAWAQSCPGPSIEGRDCRVPTAGRDVALIDLSGHVIGRARTSEKGEFLIAAKPGSYRVTVPSTGKLATCRSTSVVVAEHAFAEITIECDNGMR